MKRALFLGLVLAAAPVAAQPAAPIAAPPSAPVVAQPAAPQPCTVTYVRAPDDVRAVVDSWVRAEPQCNSSLELRIVPTEGGLYLLARDSSGRLRERMVPDAQSAGVLVASWVAAESTQSPYDVRRPPTPEPAAVPPSAMLGREGLLAPGEGSAPGMAPVVVAAQPAGKPRWLSLGGMVAMSGTGGGGLRGELDLATRGFATFGIAASATQSGTSFYGGTSYQDYGTIDSFDAKALAYVLVGSQWGRWHMRADLAAGLVYTAAVLEQPSLYMSRTGSGVFPAGELGVSLGREVGARWSIDMGPILSLYFQQYEIESSGPGYYSSSTMGRDPDLMMYFGVRHRL